MLGPIGSELMNIFRLLSPDEIDRYIVDKKVQRVEGSMAAGGEEMEFNTEDSNLSERHKEQLKKDQKAKIIPISQYQEEKEERPKSEQHQLAELADMDLPTESEEENTDPSFVNQRVQAVSPKSDLESIGVLSGSTIKELEAQRMAEENSKKESATVFLLRERQKMRQSKQKLIHQQAHKQYKSNAAQEFYQQTEEDLLSDDPQTDTSKGILVNKRHY